MKITMRNKIEDKKRRLLKASDEYEAQINQDITVVSDTAKEWGGRLLVIGGAMVLSYLSVRAILGKKSVKKKDKSVKVRSSRTSARDILLKSLSDKAALVLLELVREYIVKLLLDSSDKHDR
jgi:hypothetical protein